jgi:hypothetical protein
MQMFIVLKSSRFYESVNQYDHYRQILNRFKELGIDDSKVVEVSKMSQSRFLVVEFPFQPTKKTPIKEIKIHTSDQLMIGYRFISDKPKRRHLTLKTFLDHFDRLIIEQNFVLLRELYSMEYDLWDVELH